MVTPSYRGWLGELWLAFNPATDRSAHTAEDEVGQGCGGDGEHCEFLAGCDDGRIRFRYRLVKTNIPNNLLLYPLVLISL